VILLNAAFRWKDIIQVIELLAGIGKLIQK